MVRKLWFWLTLAAAVFLLLLGFRAYAIRKDVERWQAYQSIARQAGEDLGVESWMPSEVADADNAMAHLWIVAFLTSEGSPESRAIAALRAWPDLALDGYAGPEEGRSWFDGREEDIARVREAAEARTGDLTAIHGAAGRPGCLLPVDFSRPFGANDSSWRRVTEFQKALSVVADAELAHGDGDAATRHIEALFRWANHVHSQNHVLAMVVGTGFEKDAVALAQAALERNALTPANRQRLLAAMRTRPGEQELHRAMKLERAWFLATLDEVILPNPQLSVRSLLHPPDRLIATNSLFFCHALDAVNPPTRNEWLRFEERLRTLEPDLRHGLASLMLGSAAGLISELFRVDDEMHALRAKLGE